MSNDTTGPEGAPSRVYLTYGDGTPIEPDEVMNFELDDILWSREQQTEIDVEYVRVDVYDEVKSWCDYFSGEWLKLRQELDAIKSTEPK